MALFHSLLLHTMVVTLSPSLSPSSPLTYSFTHPPSSPAGTPPPMGKWGSLPMNGQVSCEGPQGKTSLFGDAPGPGAFMRPDSELEGTVCHESTRIGRNPPELAGIH
jgi:hypothetical protein